MKSPKKILEAKYRRLKRRRKAKKLWGYVSRSAVRKAVWDVVSLYIRLRDKKKYGNKCRVGIACNGEGVIECAYHLIEQNAGDAVRYDEENIVGACCACNSGEHWHRRIYRKKHDAIFGEYIMYCLEKKSEETVHYSTAELLEIKKQFQAKIEAL